MNSGHDETRTELLKEKKKFRKLVRDKKRQYKQSIIDQMKTSNNKGQKEFWKLFKKLESAQPNDKNYVSHSHMYKHFKHTFNSDRTANMPLDSCEKGILDYKFTIEELKKVLRC